MVRVSEERSTGNSVANWTENPLFIRLFFFPCLVFIVEAEDNTRAMDLSQWTLFSQGSCLSDFGSPSNVGLPEMTPAQNREQIDTFGGERALK